MNDAPIRLDFRSDTVTRPSVGMRAAMAAAEVGDDVFGEDPTVGRLEARVASMLGKPAGLLLSSGTQSNLAAILSHCQRGDEVLYGQSSHLHQWEGGGAAVLGGVQTQPLPNQADGAIDLAALEAAIKPDDIHCVATRLIAIENTQGGKVLPLSYLREVGALARRRGLAAHLDGARLFNASVASGVDVKALADPFDTVSVCLSKGLGAPVGSVLAGSEALISKARRWRKVLGGGMRQAGLLAAAGLYALDHNVARLAVDHDNARLLGEGLASVEGIALVSQQTNVVFVRLDSSLAATLPPALRERGVGALVASDGLHMRWLTHLDVDRSAVEEAVETVRALAG